MSDVETANPAAPPLAIEQNANMKSFALLSLKNGLLNIVTLTLYRFWGKTEVRRRLWASTYINGEPLEYLGRGVELFIGFLLALVVLGLPFLVFVFAIQLMGPLVAGFIIIPFYAFLFALVGFGQFTAFRYLASRTSWRGVRCLLRGSAVEYGYRYLGYALLSSITLGWFWPAAQRRLAEPLWHGLRFGDRRFRFSLTEARKSPVYPAFALLWIGGIVAYFVLVGSMFAMMASTLKLDEGGAPPEASLAMIGQIYLMTGILALVMVVLYAPYQAAALRSVARGISFEGVRFKLKVGWLDMAVLTITNALLVVFTLGFLLPLVQARTIKFVVNRLQTEGGVDLAEVRQAADVGPRYGEGLADAFGISPI